jgi:parallel beta-helix repeat protein
LKKRYLVALLILILFSAQALACDTPINGKTITYNKNFCNGRYYLPDGIIISGDNIIIDCNKATLQGDFKGSGISIINSDTVELKNCHIANHAEAVYLYNSTNVIVRDSILLRNLFGIKLVKSNNNQFDQNRDVSITEAVRVIESENNYIRFTNKDVTGVLCRHNNCNDQSKAVLSAKEIDKSHYNKKNLLRFLQEMIKEWTQ